MSDVRRRHSAHRVVCFFFPCPYFVVSFVDKQLHYIRRQLRMLCEFPPACSLKEEVDKYHKEGTHVPQLEQRMVELKDFLKEVVHADEVDPNNEWAIKANQLL